METAASHSLLGSFASGYYDLPKQTPWASTAELSCPPLCSCYPDCLLMVCTSHTQEQGDWCHIHSFWYRRASKGIRWHWFCRGSLFTSFISKKNIVMSHLTKSPEKPSGKISVFHARVSKENANSSMSIDHVKVFSSFLYTRQWLPSLNTQQGAQDHPFLQVWLNVLYLLLDTNSAWKNHCSMSPQEMSTEVLPFTALSQLESEGLTSTTDNLHITSL